ncbi:MAG: hypothetical protein ACR2IE_04480 [Candidatus Sumerlaeaceae bacterium]
MSKRSPFEWGTLDIRIKRLLPTIVVVALGLLALDFGFRRWQPFDYYGGWGSPNLRDKIEGIEKVKAWRGRVDVLTLSTSVGRPMDVRQWEEACAREISCYNFGFPDQRPERQRFMFEKYFWPKYHPKHVIYGVSPPDVSSGRRGMNPDHPRTGDFWQFSAVRRLAAQGPMQKLRVKLEDVSALFGARHHVRATLQNGEIPFIKPEKTIGNGVYIPTPRRLLYGPQELAWTYFPGMEIYNTYADYWLPENGEFGELLKLAKFCKKHGVQFTVVEIPTSDYAHTQFFRPKEDYTTFTRALDWLKFKGVDVLPMARELNLDNTYYEDIEHLNRWGAQLITDYVYERVICRWFPDKVLAPVLPQPRQIELWKRVAEGVEGMRVESRYGITKDAQYPSYKQVVVTSSGVSLRIASVTAGSYSFELYAGDGTTTSPEQTGEARLQLAIQEDTARAPHHVLLNTWVNARLGISYTQYHFTVGTSATLALQVDRVGERPCILDTVFLRRKLSNTGDGFTIE